MMAATNNNNNKNAFRSDSQYRVDGMPHATAAAMGIAPPGFIDSSAMYANMSAANAAGFPMQPHDGSGLSHMVGGPVPVGPGYAGAGFGYNMQYYQYAPPPGPQQNFYRDPGAGAHFRSGPARPMMLVMQPGFAGPPAIPSGPAVYAPPPRYSPYPPHALSGPPPSMPLDAMSAATAAAAAAMRGARAPQYPRGSPRGGYPPPYN